MATYEIREKGMTGKVLGTVEVAADDRGRCTDPEHSGCGAIEIAANLGASLPAVVGRFRGPRAGFGINRETGTPGLSGVFSLRGNGGSHVANIHVAKQ